MTNISLQYEDEEDAGFVSNTDETVLDAADRTGVAMANECRSGQCRTCLARIVSGEIEWSSNSIPNLSPAELSSGLVLPCIARAKTACAFTLPYTRQSLLPVRERKASVVSVEMVCPNVYHVILTTPARLPALRFLPGQYVSMTLPGGQVRHYSMSSAPGRHRLEFFVKRIANGAMCKWLEGCSPGDTLPIRGPFGAFYRRNDTTSSVFVAGGTGLAPILSMLQDIGEADRQNIRIVFGVTAPADLFGLDVLTQACARLGAEAPRLAMAQPGNSWRGTIGTVCDALDNRDVDIVRGSGRAYICGPPPMTETCLAWFWQRGAKPNRVHSEAFVARIDG